MNSENIFLEKYKYYFLLIGLGLFIYFNALFGDFVWDDIAQVQNNSLIQSLTNLPNLFLGGTYAPQTGVTGAGLYYRPLMSFIFSLIYPLSYAKPFLFHLIQITIHIVNASLIFFLFKKFFKEHQAFILALIFVAHPLNVEAVSFISALGEPLFVLFGLSALLLFIKENSIKKNILIGILLLCSLFAKETGVVFIVILLSYYLLFPRKKWRLLTFFCLTIIPLATYLFMRFSLAKVHIERLPDVPMMAAPLADRIFTMPAIFWFYIRTFFFPKDLFILQRWSVFSPNEQFYIPLFFCLLVLFGIFAVGVWVGKTNKHNLPAFLFFTVWFFSGVGIHMQFIPLDFTVADRYFYFAMIGLLGLIGISLSNIKTQSQQIKIVGITCIILIVTILSLRTLIRNTNWANGLALYSHDLQYKKNDRIQNALAIELANAGRLDEANKHFLDLLKQNPKEPALYFNIASVYEDEGKAQQAEDMYRKGLFVDDTGVMYAGLSRLLLQQEEFIKARETAEHGLKKFPNNVNLWLLKAWTNYKLGDKQNALKDAEKAKELLPNEKTHKIYNSIINDLPL